MVAELDCEDNYGSHQALACMRSGGALDCRGFHREEFFSFETSGHRPPRCFLLDRFTTPPHSHVQLFLKGLVSISGMCYSKPNIRVAIVRGPCCLSDSQSDAPTYRVSRWKRNPS